MLERKFEISGTHVVAETFDNDAIVLDVARGLYFSFSDSASLVWHALCSGSRPRDLLGLGGPFDADGLGAFVERLVSEQLIVATDSPPTSISPDIAGRIASTVEVPELFVFNDLADLFLVDPVHDTDAEAGWPVLQKAH